jgi:hypothetical protein
VRSSVVVIFAALFFSIASSSMYLDAFSMPSMTFRASWPHRQRRSTNCASKVPHSLMLEFCFQYQISLPMMVPWKLPPG